MKLLRQTFEKKNGFSLVELTIAITIISVIFATSLSLISAKMELSKIKVTESRMAVIEESLQRFIINGPGYLPCPANADTDVGAAGYGTENRNGTNCVVHATGNIQVFNTIRGAVPVDVLGLSREEYIIDGWGNKFTYVIDSNLAYNEANFRNVAAGSIFINITTRTGAVNTVPNAIYVIISHGKNGHGAWTRYGGARIDKQPEDDDEIENADADKTYIKAYPDFFSTFDFDSTDDIVTFKTKQDILTKNS